MTLKEKMRQHKLSVCGVYNEEADGWFWIAATSQLSAIRAQRTEVTLWKCAIGTTQSEAVNAWIKKYGGGT